MDGAGRFALRTAAFGRECVAERLLPPLAPLPPPWCLLASGCRCSAAEREPPRAALKWASLTLPHPSLLLTSWPPLCAPAATPQNVGDKSIQYFRRKMIALCKEEGWPLPSDASTAAAAGGKRRTASAPAAFASPGRTLATGASSAFPAQVGGAAAAAAFSPGVGLAATLSSPSRLARLSSADGMNGLARVDELEPKPKKKATRKYVPRFGSGGFGILVGMARAAREVRWPTGGAQQKLGTRRGRVSGRLCPHQGAGPLLWAVVVVLTFFLSVSVEKPGFAGSLTKADLIAYAQPYSNSSYTELKAGALRRSQGAKEQHGRGGGERAGPLPLLTPHLHLRFPLDAPRCYRKPVLGMELDGRPAQARLDDLLWQAQTVRTCSQSPSQGRGFPFQAPVHSATVSSFPPRYRFTDEGEELGERLISTHQLLSQAAQVSQAGAASTDVDDMDAASVSSTAGAAGATYSVASSSTALCDNCGRTSATVEVGLRGGGRGEKKRRPRRKQERLSPSF